MAAHLADRAGLVVVVDDPITGTFQQLAQPQLADLQRLIAHINAVVRQEVEGVKPHLGVPLSAVQSVEICNAVGRQDNRFAVNDE